MSSTSDIFTRVRGAVDIVDVIGEHVALKRAGREFKGLCPFHEDHRPSMAVVPHKQIFHCFVCGTGGDVFKFVKEFHKMGNGEALRMLAQRAGIKLPDLPRGRGAGGGGGEAKDAQGLSPRERIAATNEWACAFFEKFLRSPQGKAGLEYFHSRGLTDETIAKFRLGMSPDSWTGLVNAAMRGGPGGAAISNEHLLEAGLIKQRQDSSPYDAFRNRVMFPIIDATGGGGRVIAFGGRVLVEKRDEAGNVVEAKYLNSPETKLFTKSESLYGLNHARQQIIRTRTAVVVEGYMDVIACHQAGVTNVIATLGTALTPEHARVLKNYAQTVVLVFDSDDAGRRAADRALEVFVRGSLDIKLASVPDGKDPCDFCMKNGGEPFQKLIDHATDAMTSKWQALQNQFHATDSITARQEAVTTFLRFVSAAIQGDPHSAGPAPAVDPVRRGLLLAKTAGLVTLPVSEVQTLLKKLAQSSSSVYRNSPPSPPQPGTASATSAEQNISDESTATITQPRLDCRTLNGLAAAEAWLLGALLARPTTYDSVRDHLSLSLFQTFHSLASALMEYFDNHAELSACTLPEIITTLEDPELVRQAIELEARTSDWLDPASLSPNHIKLLQHLTTDRGLSLESLIADALKELQIARGTSDPQIDADLGAAIPEPSAEAPDKLAIALREIEQIKSRNATGGNRRFAG